MAMKHRVLQVASALAMAGAALAAPAAQACDRVAAAVMKMWRVFWTNSRASSS